MVEASPEIQHAFRPMIYRDAIEYPETASVLRVLSPTKRHAWAQTERPSAR